ncbi:MAG: hypothetical protein IPJ32_10425 [Sphingobacteriaceae bacterium]|nr:hypothetical protein [Sphingobacteriaceae bacterium]
MATLFKMMHWPGAGPLLVVGSFALIGAFSPLCTNMKIKTNAMNAGQFVFVITLSMYAIVLTTLLTMNVSGPVLERFSRDEADNSNIVKYFEKKKERLLSELSNDSTQVSRLENFKSVSESASAAKKLIYAMRIELVEYVEGVDKATAQNLVLHPNDIIRKDNYDIVNALLLNGQGTNNATALKTAIDNYKSTVLKVATQNEKLSTKINGLLNTNSVGEGETLKTWEEANFRNNMLISALSRLSDIEKNICLIETEV